jgi:hypothetical protein
VAYTEDESTEETKNQLAEEEKCFVQSQSSQRWAWTEPRISLNFPLPTWKQWALKRQHVSPGTEIKLPNHLDISSAYTTWRSKTKEVRNERGPKRKRSKMKERERGCGLFEREGAAPGLRLWQVRG